MTFNDQILLTKRVGFVALGVAALLICSMFATGLSDNVSLSYILGTFSSFAMLVAMIAFLFGIVLRRDHRRAWFKFGEPSTLVIFGYTIKQRVLMQGSLSGMFWRWWMHIDGEGNDRDSVT